MAIDTAPFEGQLLTTRQQLDVLGEYNECYWGGHFNEADLAAVPVDDRPQTFDNARVIHPDFGDMVATVEAWRKVFMSYRETHWNTIANPRDFGRFIRTREQAVRYDPGIHVVSMDLTRNSDDYTTASDAHAAAEQTPGLQLAHAEGIALMGLHETLREPGGFAAENLPYLPGYQAQNVFVPGTQNPNWNWGTLAMDYGGRRGEGWGLRIFPASGRIGLRNAVLLVHGETDKPAIRDEQV